MSFVRCNTGKILHENLLGVIKVIEVGIEDFKRRVETEYVK